LRASFAWATAPTPEVTETVTHVLPTGQRTRSDRGQTVACAGGQTEVILGLLHESRLEPEAILSGRVHGCAPRSDRGECLPVACVEAVARIRPDNRSAGVACPPLPGEPPLVERRANHLQRRTHQTHLIVGWPRCGMRHPDSYVLKVIERILGIGGHAVRPCGQTVPPLPRATRASWPGLQRAGRPG